jgi:hypothetical protein
MSRERFSRIAGREADARLSVESFIADFVQQDVPPDAARAALSSVVGVGAGGGVSFDAYAFASALLLGGGGAPAQLLRAIATRYAHASARKLLHDLSNHDGHVRWLAHVILGTDVDGDADAVSARVPAAALLTGAPLVRLQALGLEPTGLLRAPARVRTRVVLDGRTAIARVPLPAADAAPVAAAAALGQALGSLVHYDSISAGLGGMSGDGDAFGALAPCRLDEDAAFSAPSSPVTPPPLTRVRSERIGGAHVSRGLQVDAELLTSSRWRGPLAPARGTGTFELAQAVIERARVFAAELGGGAADRSRPSLASPDGHSRRLLMQLLGVADAAAAATALRSLARAATSVLAAQPALVRVRQPAKVLGAVRGAFSRALELLHCYGFPSARGPGGDVETVSYVFAGGLLDGGAEQLPTAALLFALKLAFPTRVWLLNGGDDGDDADPDRAHMGRSSLLAACTSAFADGELGATVCADVRAALGWLPAAALVGGSVLVVHGGLGGGATWGLRALEDAAEASRPFAHGVALPPVLAQAFCSEPLDDDGSLPDGGRLPSGGAEQRPLVFGSARTRAFCAREGVSLVVRGRSRVRSGFHVAHWGRLVSVFSARDCGRPPTAADVARGDDGAARAANATTARSGCSIGCDAALLLLADDDEGCLRVRAKVLASALLLEDHDDRQSDDADDSPATDGAAAES